MTQTTIQRKLVREREKTRERERKRFLFSGEKKQDAYLLHSRISSLNEAAVEQLLFSHQTSQMTPGPFLCLSGDKGNREVFYLAALLGIAKVEHCLV